MVVYDLKTGKQPNVDGGRKSGNTAGGVVSMLCNVTQQVRNWVQCVLMWEVLHNVLLFRKTKQKAEQCMKSLYKPQAHRHL